MGFHNKNLRVAIGFTAFAFILIFLAFVAPYWLVFDGQLKNPKFLNLGEFNNFVHVRGKWILGGAVD